MLHCLEHIEEFCLDVLYQRYYEKENAKLVGICFICLLGRSKTLVISFI